MQIIKPHAYGDFFALETWCSERGLRLVCHTSIRLITDKKIKCTPRNTQAAAHLQKIQALRFYSTDELIKEFAQDSSVLWFSAASYISGMILREASYMPSVDRWSAVAGFSAFSGAYGGISLYQWIKPKLVRQEMTHQRSMLLNLE